MIKISVSPDHILGKVCVSEFAVKCKFVFRVSIRNFVDFEEMTDGLQQLGEDGGDVLNGLHVLLSGLQSIDGNDFPVRLTSVEQAENPEDLGNKSSRLVLE